MMGSFSLATVVAGGFVMFFTGLTTGSFHDQRHGSADPDILLTAADVENKAFSMLFVLFLWRLSRPINPREVRLGAARYFES